MLNKDLANNFIKKVRDKIKCDVSIMDLSGKVISSTNVKYVNRENVNGKIVAKKLKQLEITSTNKDIIEILNPIIYCNKIEGVLSVSGKCENIREYSHVVMAGIELALGSNDNLILKRNQYIFKEYDNNLINKILEENMGLELLNTLLVYIDNNGERNKAAKELHIHRNTLNYRLNKIEDITGLSFNNYVDLRDYVTAYIEYLGNRKNIEGELP